jgi:hypothetical protein
MKLIAPYHERFARLRDIADHVASDMVMAFRIEQLMKVANQKDLGSVFNRTAPVHALKTIRWTLYCQITLILARLHDPKSDERKSLPSAFDLLADQTMRSGIVEWHASIRGSVPDARAALQRVVSTWYRLPLIPADAALSKLRTLRHHQLAHLVPFEPREEPKVNFEELFAATEATGEIVDALADLMIIGRPSIMAERSVATTTADAFYEALLAGGRIKLGDGT